MSIGIIILAAGSSSRLGQSKQLITIQGKTLLERTTHAAIDSGAHPIVVVLGNLASTHKKIIESLPVSIAINEHWNKGMGSSLKKGLQKLLADHPDTKAIVVTVCDQPYLTSGHLKDIISVYLKTKSPLVASHYNGVNGVPSLFDKTLFQRLLQLDDHEGARKMIQQYAGSIEEVPFEKGEIDIDTPEDLNNLTNYKD